MKKKILIIDDDLIYQEIIRKLLFGIYDLALAYDANEAIEYLDESGTPDLIIADLNLPGVHGLGLISSLKDRIGTKGINILVISGMDDANLKKDLNELGVTEILMKPVEREELKEKVKLLIEKTPTSI